MAESDINPSSLANGISSAPNGNGAPGPSKPTPILTNAGKSASNKPAQSAPRVDLEPLYTSLKTLIPDHWTTYKSAVSRFVLGFLNQDELARQTSHFIAIDPAREHLHNHLLCAIHANVLRDAPEPGVASWVSANDKPTSVAKPATGDAAEQRLKAEVMQLPARFRHRMKAVKDEPRQPLTHAIHLAQSARRLPTSTSTTTNNLTTSTTPLTATTPSTQTTSTGLNKDQEIRRRYTAPLISETRDFPPASALSERVLPICYEEGLPAGAAPMGTVGELLSTALDFFVKESLTSILAPSRANAPVSDGRSSAVVSSANKGASATTTTNTQPTTNGASLPPSSQSLPSSTLTTTPAPHTTPTHPPAPPSTRTVHTSTYLSRIAHENQLAATGTLKRNEAGLLPVEIAAAKAQGQGRGLPGDLRLAWELRDPWLRGLMPWLGERVLGGLGGGWDEDGSEDVEMMDVDGFGSGHSNGNGVVNGVVNSNVNANGATTTPETTNTEVAKKKTMTNGNGPVKKITLPASQPEPEPEPPDDAMMLDEADWGWQGASRADHTALGSLLDDCLLVGE